LIFTREFIASERKIKLEFANNIFVENRLTYDSQAVFCYSLND